ncbi:glycosyltransferase family 2 protein [Candidatus Dependentiae bacterium]|nr:glycosyltransferase family 2 protein [Candidatus Dependentiae bacterium]
MTIRQMLLVVFFSLGSQAGHAALDPLLVILLMVKNEREVIIPTLESYLPKGENAQEAFKDIGYVLYDTGSTDGTQEVAREFFERNGVTHFVIKEEPFVPDDFAASRNNGLAFTRAYFPNSTFILFPDAEWYLNSADLLLGFCRSEKNLADRGNGVLPCYYQLNIEKKESGGTYVFPTQRLFLTADDVKFEGKIHECPTKISEAAVSEAVYFTLGSSKTGQESSTRRWYRDRDVLLKELLADPDNPRTALYLGLTELWLGNLRNSYTYLKLRIKLHSYPEEDYFAYYKLGIVTMILAKQEPHSFTWNEAHGYFLKAYSLRPHRAEPLVRIATHYIEEDNHPLSYIYSKRAIDIPRPEHEKLEVECHLYDYERWEALSRSAWHFGEYELGEQATRKAIESCPNYPHLYRNLALFWDKLPTHTTQGGVA